MPGAPARILVVEDAEELRELLVLLLEGEGFAVTACEDDVQALASLRRERPDLVLTDLMLGAASGLDLITRIQSDLAPPLPPIVACSGFRDFEAEALRRGAVAFIPKPFEHGSFLAAVRKVLTSRCLARSERDEAEVKSQRLRARAVEAARVALERLAPRAAELMHRAELTTGFLTRYFGFGQAFVTFLGTEQMEVGASSHPSIWRRGAHLDLHLCQDVMESRSPLVIPDLAAVGTAVRGPTGQPLRFFAGVPLLADTIPVGALCLVDPERQSFGSDGFAVLEALGRRATAFLSARDARLVPLWTASGLLTREALTVLLTVELSRMQLDAVSLGLAVFAAADADIPVASRSAGAELARGRFGALFAREGADGGGQAARRFINEVAGRAGFGGGALLVLSSGTETALDAGGLLSTAERLLEKVLGTAPRTVQQIVVRCEPLEQDVIQAP